MTFDFVVDHAQKNVWCVPNQDRQARLEPAKITPLGGVWNTVRIMWRDITLPVPNVHFHLYNIGQFNNALLGLPDSYGVWTSFQSAMNAVPLIVDIYAASGVQMPRFACWYMMTRDKDLIIAVQDQSSINIDLDSDPIFLRFYSNAYYNSQASSKIADFIKTNGSQVLNSAAIVALQNEYQTLQSQMAAGTIPKGEVYAFVNGWRVSQIDLFTAKVGDCVEYIYDSSIYAVVDIPVANMPVFTSTLDSKLKYLVHYPGLGDQKIDYQDDIDLFLYQPIAGDQQGRWSGLYYHRNNADAVRMVTHKDYAIPTTYVQAYAAGQPAWTDISKLTLRLHIRKAGMARPLVFENNRIHELYKLPDAEIVQAMVGVNATVPNWQAATLEASAYTQIMRQVRTNDITNLMVQNAYGYNAISKLIGDTPQFTRAYSGQTIADIPYSLSDNCTGYEYDVNGQLLGFFQHRGGTTYVASSSLTNLVEMVSGQGGQLLDETYGQNQVALMPGRNYRYYTCPIDPVTGHPTFNWTDVTGSGQYAVQNNQATWLIDTTKTYTLVRGDTRFLAYELSLPMTAGVLQFSLTQQAVRFSQIQNIVMEIPMGELQLWLNGFALIEGIDYFVKFPQVVITNKNFLKNAATDPQDIMVRFMGFCNSDLTRTLAEDVGWVKYGRLSDNNMFDIRDDKVLSIIAGGRAYDRSQLTFQETTGAVIPQDARNGEPYQIRDIVTPLDGLVNADTYSLRAQAQAIDQVVAAYMTARLQETDPDIPSVIPDLWRVYSPFFSRIMADLLSGQLAPSFLTGNYSDQDVKNACASYEWLLVFDQTQDAQLADTEYMVVQPHIFDQPVTVSIYIYKFLTRVVSLYLHNRVDMSTWVNIEQIAAA